MSMKEIRKLPASAGAQWLLDTFSLYRRAPLQLARIGLAWLLVSWVVTLLSTLIPGAAGMAVQLMTLAISPIMFGGMLYAVGEIDEGRPGLSSHLLQPIRDHRVSHLLVPLAIQVLAVLLLAAYHYAFGISVAAGLVTIAVLLVCLPWLIRGALRFRLGNTSYRGLHFHFSGSVPMAYRVYLAPIAVFLLPGVLVAVVGETPWVTVAWLLYLGWPLMYAWMKHYQYGYVAYGDQPSSNALAVPGFFSIYVRGSLLATSIVIVAFLAGVVAMPLGALMPVESAAVAISVVVGGGMALMAYALLGPYQQVRVMNLCLRHTAFPGVRLVSTLSARGFARLQLKNLALTLLTLGLYRPFAVVSAYRDRLDHLALDVDEGFDHVVSRVTAGGGAAGDGAADFVGLDLSW